MKPTGFQIGLFLEQVNVFIIFNKDNFTTLFLAAASFAGMIFTKRRGLYYQGFAFTFGATFVLDYVQRRELDRTTVLSYGSSYSYL